MIYLLTVTCCWGQGSTCLGMNASGGRAGDEISSASASPGQVTLGAILASQFWLWASGQEEWLFSPGNYSWHHRVMEAASWEAKAGPLVCQGSSESSPQTITAVG